MNESMKSAMNRARKKPMIIVVIFCDVLITAMLVLFAMSTTQYIQNKIEVAIVWLYAMFWITIVFAVSALMIKAINES